MSDLLTQLNPQQRAAVTLPDEHALILAGAGSGKTRVLTTRIAWLISSGRVSPAGILAVTFTNKAAREMQVRLSTMLPISIRGMWIGTFHGLCNRMLRAHHRDAALPQSFQILDTQDQLSAVKRLLKGLNVDDQKFPPKNVQYFISGNKEEGRRPDKVEIVDDHTARLVEFYRAYDDQCQREGVVDFAELMLRSHELLQRSQPLREHYQHRFRHILIDEFQDTNDLQYRWLKLLAGEHTRLFAVGDDDQSIYSFRGAKVANMAAFEREFARDNLIKLEQNYRSHAHILNSANHLIRQNSRRLGKDLWTDAGTGEPVRVYEAMTDGEEAQWLLEEIRSLIGEGALRSEIAILYRSNAQSRVIEHALFSAKVPYKVYGGLRFFERAEVKHALAYLRLIENPDDDTAFLRVVNFPVRGIGARTIEQLQDLARRDGASLYRTVSRLQGAAAAKLGQFIALIERLRKDIQSLPLTEAVDHLIEASGLIAHYRNDREGQDRIENLRELVNAAAAFLADEGVEPQVPSAIGVAAADTLPVSPLAGFLAHASLESGEGQAGDGVDSVQLMTVHAAKGLEFDAVFITGVEEGLFPHENSIAAEGDGLEEERRLMYVAITRARRRLYLSFAQTRMLHGQTRYNVRSRFLGELPPDDLKWLTPQQGIGGWGSSRHDAFGDGGGHGGGFGQAGGFGQGGGGRRGGYRDGGRPALSAADRAPMLAPMPARVLAAGRDGRFRIGQNVGHARFGEGVVIGLEGSGSDARIQINFGRQGTKWLALSVAKLEPVGPS